MHQAHMDISWRSVVPSFYLQCLPCLVRAMERLSWKNQRNQRLRCLEREAFSFRNASATFPCPEQTRGFSWGKKVLTECRRVIILLLVTCTAALLKGSVRLGLLCLRCCTKLNKWRGLKWWSCITSSKLGKRLMWEGVDSTCTSHSRLLPLTKRRAKVKVLRVLTKFSTFFFFKSDHACACVQKFYF